MSARFDGTIADGVIASNNLNNAKLPPRETMFIHSIERFVRLGFSLNAMHANGIGAVPVCEIGIRMVGIVSERDLVHTFATTGCSELGSLRVRDIMTTRVKSCGPDEDMRTAEQLMRRNHFRHVPVVDAGHVVGMLSIRDTQALRLRQSEDEINVLRDVVVAARYR